MHGNFSCMPYTSQTIAVALLVKSTQLFVRGNIESITIRKGCNVKIVNSTQNATLIEINKYINN